MNETKHTPGPWETFPVGPSFKVGTADMERFAGRNHYMEGEPFVCEISADFGTDADHDAAQKAGYYRPRANPERVEANARLIAAAPELLSSLLEYVQLEESAAPYSASPMRLRARAIIAKATGVAP